MSDKRMAYIDQICRVVKNILIDRTNYETERISVNIVWWKGEKPHIEWEYSSKNEDTVEIEGGGE